MEKVSTVYVNKRGWQPICTGTDPEGELAWSLRMKEPWHLKMFPVPYGGDFSEQSMWLCIYERGHDWPQGEL